MKESEVLNKRFNPYDLNDIARVDSFIKSNHGKNSSQATENKTKNKPQSGFFHVVSEQQSTNKKR